MSRTAEEQARRHLWLFPRWMRPTRGEEAVSRVLDLLPEGATRLPVRSRIDLTRAGLHARRTGTVPWKVWWSVVTAAPKGGGGTVPPEWRPWLVDGLPRRGFVLRAGMTRSLWFLMFVILWSAPDINGNGSSWNPIAGLMAIGTWVLVAYFYVWTQGDRWLGTVRLRNGLAPDGRPLPPHEVGRLWSPPGSPNVWALPALLAGAAVHVGAAGYAMLTVDPDGDGAWMYWVVVAMFLGFCLYAIDLWARTRTASITPEAPSAVHPPRTGWSLGTAVAVGVAVVVASFVSVVAGLVTYVFGFGTQMLWVLALGAADAAGRCVLAQRRQSRTMGLWDLFPSTGPQVVLGQRALPPPPDPPGQGSPAIS